MGTKNITYLLGAGASANALPVINNLNDRLQQFLYYLNEITITWKESSDIKNIKEYYNLLKWLSDESKFHQSIDTFAKKLYLTDKKSFVNLKKALIFYFILEQSIKLDELENFENKNIPKEFKNESLHTVNETQLDKRYDNLIASLLNKNGDEIEVNQHIKILTWNYDIQFELALKRYFQTNIEGVKELLHIFPSKFWSKNYNNNIITDDKFIIVKLNGEAYLSENLNYSPQSKDSIVDTLQFGGAKFIDIIGFIIEYIKRIENDKSSFELNLQNFTFAWEDQKPNGYYNLFNLIQKFSEKTDVLIVIGYSFPYFNSDIDRKILNWMKPKEIIICNSLDKI